MATKPFFICKYAPSSSAIKNTIYEIKRTKVRALVRMKVGRESVRGHSKGAHLRAPIVASTFWAVKDWGNNSKFVRFWNREINRGNRM